MLTAATLAAACLIHGPAMPALAVAADGWAHWRGPDRTGYVADATPPLEWSETKNIRWKAPVKGLAHSTPIVIGDRIYLMTALKTERTPEKTADATTEQDTQTPSSFQDGTPPPQRGQGRNARQRGQEGRQRGGRGGRGRGAAKPTNIHEFGVIALNRADGKKVWETTVCEAVPHEAVHQTASFASSSPATDGEHIYAFFGSRGIFCLDLEGTVKWQKDLGDQTTRNSFGEGASPAVHGDTVVIPWDHEGESFVVALDKTTGAEKWRKPRQEQTNWTSPLIMEVNGSAQAILAGHDASVGYDLATGEEVWRCGGMTMNVIPMPIPANDMLYLTSGFRGSSVQAIDIKAAKGDITGTPTVKWTVGRGAPYVPSPMVAGDRMYLLRGTNGIISCFNAMTGEEIYNGERIEGVESVYASPTGGGNHIYVCSREGAIAVIEKGDTFKVLATNMLSEGINASPVVIGNELYLRGTDHLYCVVEAAPATTAPTETGTE